MGKHAEKKLQTNICTLGVIVRPRVRPYKTQEIQHSLIYACETSREYFFCPATSNIPFFRGRSERRKIKRERTYAYSEGTFLSFTLFFRFIILEQYFEILIRVNKGRF